MTERQSCVYTTDKEYLAVIVQAILEENEIPSFVLNQRDSVYQVGEIKIFVPAEFTIKALDIIGKNIEL
jgi:hypothetical protein